MKRRRKRYCAVRRFALLLYTHMCNAHCMYLQLPAYLDTQCFSSLVISTSPFLAISVRRL